jgi:hypothetical protein
MDWNCEARHIYQPSDLHMSDSKPQTTDPAIRRALEEGRRKQWFEAERMLQPFCSRDWRDYPMTRPFTIGEHTWASNRQILIRVEAIPFVPSYDAPSDDGRVQAMQKLAKYFQHAWREVAMRPLADRDPKLLRRLTNVMIEAQPEPGRPMSFKFDGGEGVTYPDKPRKEPGF